MLNLNVGILGHVDSGKTSLAKAMSEVASTAAFDKNPQSKARGITLDLGFSSFCISTPDHLRMELPLAEKIQITLVDCPGHASLIRTVIGGAQIIDMILLVIDATKGMQTQTAECLVIGEITCKTMIVVLNKIDLLESTKRAQTIEKMTKRLQQTLRTTCFAEAPIVSIAANPKEAQGPLSVDTLVGQISKSSFIPVRNRRAPFLFAIDHCFGIKGKGTVMTGTVLQGTISIDDIIELPAMNVTKRVKSMQMFKQPASSASAGDRLGVCVTQFDPKLMERGIACKSGLASPIYCGIMTVNRLKYFKGHINTKTKFHISIGHETSVATITCFNGPQDKNSNFDLTLDYRHCECLDDDNNSPIQQYLLLVFEKPVVATANCLVVGSKLDMDMHGSDCRIAFWGNVLATCKDKDYKSNFLATLRLFKDKCKTGIVERIVNDNTVIVKNMFKKETNLDVFTGLRVSFSTGESGIIEGSFGQSGKIKVYVKDGLTPETINNKGKNTTSEPTAKCKPIIVTLLFKNYVYDINKKVFQ